MTARRYAVVWHGMYLNQMLLWQREPCGWVDRQERNRMLRVKRAEMAEQGWRGFRLSTRSFHFKSVDGFDRITI